LSPVAPLASETTEDAESSLTEQAVIQTRNISAALPTATVEELGNIAPATRVSTTDLQEEAPAVVVQYPSVAESGLIEDVVQSFHWMMDNPANVMALVGIIAAPTGATVDLERTTASVPAVWTTGPQLTR